ncbi:MAG: hypothetical protein KAW17_08495 [Candidatus Eisenbacteria sp.]|nr:hypothetical protein [Candidatus Eisenbacteria bacterium]
MLWVTVLAGLMAGPAQAAYKWRSLEPENSPGKICIAIDDKELTYHRLEDRSALEFTLSGPRRVKIVTRYIYDEKDPARAGFTVRVIEDGAELLRKAISTEPSDAAHLCGKTDGRVGQIRRVYVDIPSGKHTYQVFVVERERKVAARVFRKVKVRETPMVSLTPLEYSSVYTLQFESGALSEHYGFASDEPLRFQIVGPTKVKVCTRLDFDTSMSGSQSYGIGVFQGEEQLRVHRYHVRKMATASYLEYPDILPGQRKCFWLEVPEGLHTYELQLVDGSGIRATAKIYIPEEDLGKGR